MALKSNPSSAEAMLNGGEACLTNHLREANSLLTTKTTSVEVDAEAMARMRNQVQELMANEEVSINLFTCCVKIFQKDAVLLVVTNLNEFFQVLSKIQNFIRLGYSLTNFLRLGLIPCFANFIQVTSCDIGKSIF